MKKILMISTGGTLVSSGGTAGLKPKIHAAQILDKMMGMADHFLVDEEELFLLDSTNVQAEEWTMLAEKIYQKRKFYDGIVVIHGTDTMAYTAAALSYALTHIEIPVVVTGSQVPIENPIADATENCRAAFHMAASGFPGVFVAFNRKIIWGTRASKVKTSSYDAFESINFPYAARIDAYGLVLDERQRRTGNEPCILRNNFCTDVFLLKLFPGISPDILEVLHRMGIRAVYIEGFGIGGIPGFRRDLQSAIRRACEHGMLIALGSQCLYGASDFSIYEVGRAVLGLGERVVETRSMTTEAVMTKLMWALGQCSTMEEACRLMQMNIAGELTPYVDWNRLE